MRARWRTRRGLSQLRRRPGGLEQSDLVGLEFFFLFFLFFFFCFVLSGSFGEKENLGTFPL